MLIPKWLFWAFIILSFIGFLDAAYLTAVHYLGITPNCTILEGCETVTTSKYATVFGVPIALFGAMYYLSVFLLSVIYFDNKNEKVLLLAAYLTPLGFLASLVLIYLQLFVIYAICLYCIVSAATSTLLFILGLILFRNKSKIKPSIT